MEHTPKRTEGEWEVSAEHPFQISCHSMHIATVRKDDGWDITKEEVQANAAFIVLAVNAHKDLVEALEEWLNWQPDGRFAPSHVKGIIQRSRAALSKASRGE